jgi:NAD(P)H dehydrogenase (quinone)
MLDSAPRGMSYIRILSILKQKGIILKRKIALILGHPNSGSYCAALADAYAHAAQAAGHELRWLRLHDMHFDPMLHAGYGKPQPLEPDLLKAQETLRWADHWVLIYPIWWGSFPALLKGFFDRVLLPGYAFRYRPNSSLWDKLLSGRNAQLITTQDTPSWYFRWVMGRPAHHQMRRTILGFCGVKTVGLKEITPIHGSTQVQRDRWMAEVVGLAQHLR